MIDVIQATTVDLDTTDSTGLTVGIDGTVVTDSDMVDTETALLT